MLSMLTVVSIGPGDPSLLTMQAADTLLHARRLFLRTDHHPVSDWLRDHHRSFESFDALYETSEDFEQLYGNLSSVLMNELLKGPVCYAVPDPVTDMSVEWLYRTVPDAAGCIRVIPGVSSSEASFCAARADLSGSSFQVAAASSLNNCVYHPDHPLLITELNSPVLAGDVKIWLSGLLDDETQVLFLQATRSGNPAVKRISLYELDRQSVYDHLSAVLIPVLPLESRSRYDLPDLEEIMERLRAPQGCPWDRIQTHESLKPYLVEEAWEAVNAIDAGDMDHLADELGDVLLQIVFHASIGKSFDEFTFTDVVTDICRKMISRHPHVFGNEQIDNPDSVSDRWETIKRHETGSKTVGESLEDVSPGLPSLKYAIKVWKKAMSLEGFRRDPRLIQQDIQKISGRLLNSDGSLDPRSLGFLLFYCTELSHRSGHDAEILLHETVDRFKASFHRIEKETADQGKNNESLTIRDECVYFNQAEERK
ncbi:MAG: nucleoside triphosphate pyrophosphohydrolase [Oscillospiraceae bacterium]|nr:nucleoside triphosphate pyrophosphohydrolase [Oscillospiraceae bacterium]